MGDGKRPLDYGMAEALAFGSLLLEGTPVRLQRAGQPARHLQPAPRRAHRRRERATSYAPLQHVAPDQARFEVYDSLLSEAAVLGFEFGYAATTPRRWCCWEAQFGDFANGAQVIIDQFIAAGEDKWHRSRGLVMLLPHGYEGQGPEHSSARIERFLQLCAEDNMQVCHPSTPAQYFHLLRRQALTPLAQAADRLHAQEHAAPQGRRLDAGGLRARRFQRVLDDPERRRTPSASSSAPARSSTSCGGSARSGRTARRRSCARAALPLPEGGAGGGAGAASATPRSVVWVQEEPANMGALSFVQPRLERLTGKPIRSVKRSASGSPATGSAKAHGIEQQTLVTLAFTT